jgi:hypothetical protein
MIYEELLTIRSRRFQEGAMWLVDSFEAEGKDPTFILALNLF